MSYLSYYKNFYALILLQKWRLHWSLLSSYCVNLPSAKNVLNLRNLRTLDVEDPKGYCKSKALNVNSILLSSLNLTAMIYLRPIVSSYRKHNLNYFYATKRSALNWSIHYPSDMSSVKFDKYYRIFCYTISLPFCK